MKKPNSAQTLQRAASARIAVLLAVIAAAVFASTILSHSFQMHP